MLPNGPPETARFVAPAMACTAAHPLTREEGVRAWEAGPWLPLIAQMFYEPGPMPSAGTVLMNGLWSLSWRSRHRNTPFRYVVRSAIN